MASTSFQGLPEASGLPILRNNAGDVDGLFWACPTMNEQSNEWGINLFNSTDLDGCNPVVFFPEFADEDTGIAYKYL